MTKVLPLALLVGLCGCSTATTWEKPGADRAMTLHDTTECRQAARQQAARYSGPGDPFPDSSYGWGSVLWNNRPPPFGYDAKRDSDRFLAENRHTSACMRSRGYELVTNEKPPAKSEPEK